MEAVLFESLILFGHRVAVRPVLPEFHIDIHGGGGIRLEDDPGAPWSPIRMITGGVFDFRIISATTDAICESMN
ncbi:MAG TPA: hypothetical protein VHP14_12305, partial [Anaerolineales bacterium]|nr:hypothetical protein [Anaerolineales bacterium]